MRHFCPPDVQRIFDAIEPFGLVLVIVLVYVGASQVIDPVLNLGYRLILNVTSPAFFRAMVFSL
jgi:hypothetical protein